MRTYLKDDYFYSTCKPQLDKCMSVFDSLCNKASITQIEDNYENRLVAVKDK